jgi:predicted small integral membrane protein
MMMERRLKILMIGGLTLLCGFIVAGNIHDPGTNLLFVQHVFSMDTIIPVSAMADHAISIPLLWRIGFWLIVMGEGLTAALFALGAVELFRARNGNARDFHQAKRFVFAGAGCGFAVWFIGFLAVGGEWFAMWQPQVWDGQPAAFRFIASILLVLIFVAQPDAEL